MEVVIIFVPLILAVCVVAAVAKLAVILTRSGTLSWKHSFFLAGFLFTLSVGGQALLRAAPLPDLGVPPLLRMAFGLALAFAFSAWFFGHHVMSAERVEVGAAGGTKPAAVMAGLLLLFALPLILLAPQA